MVRVSISGMKNGKDVRKSGVLPEMIKAVGEAGDDMITDAVYQIKAERNIPEKCELNTFVNCCRGKGDGLERRNR